VLADFVTGFAPVTAVVTHTVALPFARGGSAKLHQAMPFFKLVLSRLSGLFASLALQTVTLPETALPSLQAKISAAVRRACALLTASLTPPTFSVGAGGGGVVVVVGAVVDGGGGELAAG
jgi:hypothetical protein